MKSRDTLLKLYKFRVDEAKTRLHGFEQMRADMTRKIVELEGHPAYAYTGGKRFDPALHEAVGVAPVVDPMANGFVMVQHQPGYQFAGWSGACAAACCCRGSTGSSR